MDRIHAADSPLQQMASDKTGTGSCGRFFAEGD
jgi:hypothetical protein